MIEQKKNQITEWRQLEAFGINVLTGEADGLGRRLLCDVSKKGVDLLQELFSLENIRVFPPMNTPTLIHGEPPVGCLMLPRSLFLELAAFCLLHVHDVVIMVPDQRNEEAGWYITEHVEGFSIEDFQVFREHSQHWGWKWYAILKDGNARGGFKNVHWWSGRID